MKVFQTCWVGVFMNDIQVPLILDDRMGGNGPRQKNGPH
jgi:hypothetical protein